jgi:hypothetical protein
LKYNILFWAVMAFVIGIFRSTFAATLHTLSLLITRIDGHATGEQGPTLTQHAPQTAQHVEAITVNMTCQGEDTLAEPGLTHQGVPLQSGWNAVFKAWRQQVQRSELCAAS